jgi:hypothetical protein
MATVKKFTGPNDDITLDEVVEYIENVKGEVVSINFIPTNGSMTAIVVHK